MPTPMIIPNKHTVLQQPFSFIAQQLRDTFSILMHVCSFLYVIFNVVICYRTIQCYSQGMSSVPPKILLMNWLFEKMNPLVIPVTSVKFKSAFLHV